MSFVHLHVHSEYSLLDGCARIPALAEAARRLGFPALALTDHGAVYGAVPFVKAMRAAGVRPILGAELYVVEDHGPPPRPGSPYHLPVLAATEEGYVHLLELITRGQLDHFYKKPLVTRAEIAPRAGGLIGLSGCIRGELAQRILAGDKTGAAAALGAYREIFGRGRFFLELQRHGLPEEARVNQVLIELGRAGAADLVATNDVHYLTREEAGTHDLLLAVQTLSLVEQTNRLRLPAPEYYLKSPREMEALFADVPEAVANTERVADACRFELELGRRRIPSFPVPPGTTEGAYLRRLCREGLVRFFPEPAGEVLARLDYELTTIERLGFSGYFLIVWDIVAFARREGIPVGPGRGSSVGSLVSYLLGITSINPLAYGLLFERFLNPGRADPPDIDVDLCHRGRARVLDYIRDRYGRDHVAHLAAYTTLRPRAAVRDVGRALGTAADKIDRLARAIPYTAPDLDSALRDSAELRDLGQDLDLARIIAAARDIQGLPRHVTQHAAGVVVAAEPLTKYLALEEAGEGQIVTQADLGPIEDLGLLKIDLLGLRYLTVIEDTLAFLHEEGVNLTVEGIPSDDAATMAALAEGRTIGTFQLESGGMRQMLRRYRPQNLDDLVIILALYRPGPLGSGMVESLIRRRHGEEPVTYLHPALAEVLGDTYGVILYQEQVMEVARGLAGYNPGQADLLRKAIAKRRPEVLARERVTFTAGAQARGIPPDAAEAIFDLIAEFGHYGFAKAHSAAYALTSYRTVYLKTHYPVAYHAALLTLNLGGAESRFPGYLSETRRLGIEFLLPEINRSLAGFRPEGGGIRAGFLMVRDLGSRGIVAIIDERNARGPYASLTDFYRRLRGKGVTARASTNLVRAGAFDGFGGRAAQLLELHSARTKGYAKAWPGRSGQLSLFGEQELPALAREAPPNEYRADVCREMEREVLGHYLTQHPLERYRALLARLDPTAIESLAEEEGPDQVLLCGLAGGIRSHRTRQGGRMAFANLEDLTGQVEIVIFPVALERHGHLLRGGEPLLVWGRVDRTAERVTVKVDRVRGLADLEP